MPNSVSLLCVLKHLITHKNDFSICPNYYRSEIHIDNNIIPIFVMRNVNNSVVITIDIENYPHSFTEQNNSYIIESYTTFSSSSDVEKITILFDDIIEYDDIALVLKYGKIMLKTVKTTQC